MTLEQKEFFRINAQLFDSLSTPNRLNIAKALYNTVELSVTDLRTETGLEQSLVSHSVKTMMFAGAVVQRRDGRFSMYSLTDAAKRILKSIL